MNGVQSNLSLYKETNFNWVHSTLLNDRIDAKNYKVEYLELQRKIISQTYIRLRDVIEDIKNGFEVNRSYSDVGLKFLTVKDLKEFEINYSDIKKIDLHFRDIPEKGRLKEGDIIITRSGSIGIAKTITNNDEDIVISSHIIKLRVNNKIDRDYLTTYLNSDTGRKLIEQLSYGAVIKEIGQEELLDLLIPIPSPEIQKYIGDKVRKAEELREEAKRLKKEAEEILNRELNLNKLEESLKSSINSKHNWITSMDINDRIDSYYYKRRYILVNQHLNDYECIQIRDIASVDYGYMPTEDYADENNGVPLIRVTNMIGNLLLDLSDLKYISKSINIPDDKYVDDGDILVVQCGNTTGKIALMTKEVENYLYPSFCLRIKLRNKSINNKYLALLMEMSIIQEQIWQSASYSSVRPNTTKPAIENIRIPLIEKQKQEDVGALVEKYIDNIYQSKQLILEAKQDVEDLIEGNFDMSKVKANS